MFYVSPTQLVAQMPEDIKARPRDGVRKERFFHQQCRGGDFLTASPEIYVYGNNLAVATFTNYS
jgi:hypothetical protein